MLRQSFNGKWEYTAKRGGFGGVNTAVYTEVTLPHDAMIGTERKADSDSGNKKGYYVNDTWEYRKTFYIPEEYKSKHVYFEFEGVYSHAMVYINGDFAGQQPNGYSGFIIEADRFLKYGSDNKIKVVARTTDDSRWYTGAGIYRDVHMLVSELTHITPFGVKITTPDIQEESSIVSVATTVRSDAAMPKITTTIITEIYDINGHLVASDEAPITVFRGGEATLRQRMYINRPLLWSVEDPNLYTCKTRVLDDADTLLDEQVETFGIRSLSLDVEHGLSINGQSIKLRGACIHHDNGPIGAITMARAEERRIEILKEAGFNAIRMSHHPAGSALLAACDKIGMLVMDETFDMWTENKSNFDYALDFPTWWEKDIQAMVDKDYNHPSVIMYSIGNEIQDTGSPNGTAWGRKLAEKVRALDTTRYITNSINGMVSIMELMDTMRAKAKEQQEAQPKGDDINAMMNNFGAMMKHVMTLEPVTKATAESFACVDVAGYNYMDSRYEMDKELFPNRIICGTETFPPDIDQNWRKVQDHSNIIGDFTWTGWDYLGEAGIGKVNYDVQQPSSGIYGSFPTLTAMTGDIDILGNRRPISYYREIVFGQRTSPYIAIQRPEHYGKKPMASPWSFGDLISSWSFLGFEGKSVKVEVYSQAEKVELVLNGESLGCLPTGEANRYKAIFDITYQIGELVAIAYDQEIEVGRHTLQSAIGSMKLAVEADRSCIRADETDLAYISIKLVDEAGNLYSNKQCKVSIEVQGPGQLLGFGTANPDMIENFYDSELTLFDGAALAVIRPIGKGEINIIVTSEEIGSTTVPVRAE
jgi:beta-galactosidase